MDLEKSLVVAGGWVDEIDEEGLKFQISSCKI